MCCSDDDDDDDDDDNGNKFVLSHFISTTSSAKKDNEDVVDVVVKSVLDDMATTINDGDDHNHRFEQRSVAMLRFLWFSTQWLLARILLSFFMRLLPLP